MTLPVEERLIISLTPVKAVAIALVVGPWLAVYWSYVLGEQYLGLGADKALYLQYSFYAICLITLTLFVKSKLIINLQNVDKKRANIYHSRLVYISVCALVFIFYVA